MQLSVVHICAFIITILVTLAPGIIAARRIKSADDYNVGGRSAGPGMVAGAIIGTIVGGAATMGTAQLGFRLGLTAWWFTLGSGIALLIMAALYAVPLRNSSLTTVSEFLVQNYGKKAGWFASISSCAGIFFSVIASTLTCLHLIAGLFQISLLASAAIIVFIVMAIVFGGGLKGSGSAGILKIIFVFGSIFVGGVLAFVEMGSFSGLTKAFPASPWFSLFGKGVEDGIFSLCSMIVGVISTQTYIQALFSAKDSKTAAVGCSVAALICIPVGLPSVMIGMFMHAHHPEIDAIQALPMYLVTYMPEWLGGVGIGALLLSAMGSIAGLALGIGTMISRDIVRNLWKNATSTNLLWASRLSVLLVVIGAILFVFQHLDSSVLMWNYLSMALRGSGIFLPLTFAVFFPHRLNKTLGVCGVAAGIVAGCFWKTLFSWPANSLFPALLCNLIFLIPALIVGNKND